jgi:flagellar biosynthetic protein FliR
MDELLRAIDSLVGLRPLGVFLVALARVGGVVTFAPFWSVDAASRTIRAALALGLALVLTFLLLPRLPELPTDMLAFGALIVSELAFGALFGIVGRLAFAAYDVAAQIVVTQIGFSLASTIDPTSRAQTTSFGVMAQFLGTLFLLGLNGHHWFVIAIVRGFDAVPPGGFVMTEGLAEALIRLTAAAVSAGVGLAAPAIVMLLAVEAALALCGKVAPRFEFLVMGFPIKIAVGLWLMGATLYFWPVGFKRALVPLADLLAKLSAM